MRTYPEYKDSGVEWIGHLPKDWDIKKIKYIFWERKEKNDPIQSENLISLTMKEGVIPHSEKGTGGNKPKDDLSKYKLVYPGDIVINSMNVIVGSVGLSKYFGVVSPVYYMLIPLQEDDDVNFFNHIFRCEVFQKSLIGLGNGILVKESESSGKLNTIRMRIPMGKLGQQLLPYPSSQKQNQISDYLDRKTQKIDNLIEKTERKVELLKEQRSSLINQCVTKGLDPNVEMKDSGVEWIGEIPKEWRIDRLKYSSEFIIEKELPSDDDIKISPENVESFTGKIINYHSDYETEGMKFQIGDTLLNKLRVYLSKFVFCESDGFSMGEMIVLRPRKYLPKFQYYLLSNPKIIDHFNSLSEGVKVPRPPVNEMLNTFCPVVPIPEQKQISDYLDRETSKIDQMVDTETKRIELLKEYRQSLISNVVTGKIDVRDEVIQ